MLRTRIILSAILVVLLLNVSSAWAAKNDLFLWRFCERSTQTGVAEYGFCVPDPNNSTLMLPDNEKFAKFAREFAAVFAPKYHAPAETLGWSGWDLGFEFTLNQIPGGDHWDDALQGVERYGNEPEYAGTSKSLHAEDLLNTIQFHARKGLPYSLELGFNITYLISSEMYTAGVEGKFSFLEGFEELYIPDFAVRMTYNHLFGAPDLDLNLFGWDFSVSQNFGVGGFMQLAPYTGYSLVYAMASPHVVNPSFDADYNDRLLLLSDQNELIHRWFIGLRILASYVNFTPEVTISNVGVYQYSFHLGADF